MNKYNLYIIILAIILAILAISIFFVISGGGKENTQITQLSMENIDAGNNISIMLSDTNNTPIANSNINIQITNDNGTSENTTLTTNNEGIARIAMNTPGTYHILCSFEGNEKYNGNNTAFDVIVNEIQTTSSDSSSERPSIYFNGEYHPANHVDEEINGWNPSDHEVSREDIGDGYTRVRYDDGYMRVIDSNGYVVSHGYA